MSVSAVAQDAGQPHDVIRDAVQQRIADWPVYHRILDACGTGRATTGRLRNAWERLPSNVVPIARRIQPAEDPGPAPIPLADKELRAASAEAFITLLRRVQLRSGRKPAEIAVHAGIPRSTAYRFVDDRKNTALPTKAEQVRAFLVACRLPAHQVQQIMVLWTELRQNGPAPRTTPPVVVPAEPEQPPATTLDDAVARSDVIRFGLAVACVLTTTGLTAALTITASGWSAGPQVLAIMLMAALSTAIAASWCVNGRQVVLREPRSRVTDNGLAIKDTPAAPPVIGADSEPN
ncbi:MAG: hypothetical protein ABW215_23005 [Kibdelosporangium sp.]